MKKINTNYLANVRFDSDEYLKEVNNQSSRLTYRSAINGLRAIAVISVILFHSGLGLVPGGYVGVDIFFVISGYLITGIIYQEMQSESFSYKRFYERRIRRILPALLLVMIASIPFSWLILLPGDMKEFYKSIVFTTIFSPNIFFYRQSGYFDTQIEFKPLVHTWSLGIEEQFYFIFPLLLTVLHKQFKQYLFLVLATTAIVSFFVCEYLLTHDRSAAFYLLPSRFWELLIGGLISIGIIQNKLAFRSNIYLSLLGIALIFYSFFSFDSSTIFPGFSAIPPTLGTALVLAYTPDESFIGGILSNRYLSFIGLISYSAYLWHQPIFAFTRLSYITPLTPVQIVAALVCIFVFSTMSYFFVEQPFRNKKLISNKNLVMTLIIGFFVLFIFSYAGRITNGFQNRFNYNPVDLNEFGAINKASFCDEVDSDPSFSLCNVGSRNAEKKADSALFGDSHTNALREEADKYFEGKNRKLLTSTPGGCPPLLGLDVAQGNHAEGVCRDINEKRFEFIKNNPDIKNVYLAARWTLYTNEKVKPANKKYYLVNKHHGELSLNHSIKVFEESLTETIKRYAAINVRVIVLIQPPEQHVSPELVYSRMRKIPHLDSKERKQYLEIFSIEKNKHDDIQKQNREIINSFGSRGLIQVVNLDMLFCNESKCFIGDEFHSFYRDMNHVNNYGAKKIIHALFN